MNKPKLTYFDQEDVIHLFFAEGQETDSIELSPQITAELNAHGELIGIEILQASRFLRDSILATVPAKLLDLKMAKPV
jgi:uncharacterized protein YuzE